MSFCVIIVLLFHCTCHACCLCVAVGADVHAVQSGKDAENVCGCLEKKTRVPGRKITTKKADIMFIHSVSKSEEMYRNFPSRSTYTDPS